jgi:uncharacterized protein YjbK
MEGSGVPIERELKLAVPDTAALERVARAAEARGARSSPAVLQENHLFDTPDLLLHARGLILRLRVERCEGDERWTLTAKGPRRAPGEHAGLGEPHGDLHARAEEEAAVPATVAGAVLAGRASALDALAAALDRPSALLDEIAGVGGAAGSVALLGAFTNERTRVGPLDAGSARVALELDRTRLPDGTEACEVELELPADAVDAGRALLRELLDEAGVAGRPAGPKSGRFLAALARARG